MHIGNDMSNYSREEYIPAPIPVGASLPMDSMEDLRTSIRNVFAQVTRYPVEILDFHANLEEDLGIDSVKMGEIFSVLQEQYDLPDLMDIPRDNLTSIDGISQSLYVYLNSGQAPALSENGDAADALDPPAGITAVRSGSAMPEPFIPRSAEHEGLVQAKAVTIPKNESAPMDSLKHQVRDIFAEVTRYPVEILDFDAALEEDLGIDSVKMGEIFSVLSEKYGLPENIDMPREHLGTIGGISRALYEYVNGGQSHFTAEAPLTDLNETSEKNAPVLETRREKPETRDVVVKSFAGLNSAHKPFEGKIALITGSGHGLGKDIARYLSDLGAKVIVNSFHSRNLGISTAEEINAAGGNAMHLWGSVANAEHLQKIFDEIERTYNGLDFFISNASNGMLAKLEDITPEHWEKAFRTNIIGLHQSALRAVKLMKKRGGGKIITLSSPAAYGYVDYFGCMGAVKAAVDSLTKSMAIEFSADNIQVNCVSPGPVYGELLNKWPESERLISRWESATAYKRLCQPGDVSHFIAYLLSDEVKLFNGSVIFMDGGISARSF